MKSTKFTYKRGDLLECSQCHQTVHVPRYASPFDVMEAEERLESAHVCSGKTKSPRTRVLSGIDPRAVERRLIALGF